MIHDGKQFVPMTAIGLMVLCWVVVGRWRGPTDVPDSAALEADIKQFDLGKVPARPDYVHRIQVRNRSAHDVSVSEFKTSGNCLKVDPPALSLAAGAAETLAIHLNLPRQPESFPGQFEYPFQVLVTPTVNGRPTPRPWRLYGKATRLAIADEAEVWVGTRIEGEKNSPSRSIHVHAREPLVFVQADCDPPWISATVQQIGMTGREWQLTLVADKPQLPFGIVSGYVNLTGRCQDGTVDTLPVCKFAAELVHDVQVLQQKVVLSPQPAIAPSSQVIVLKSRSGRQFDVAAVQVQPPGVIEVCPANERHDKGTALLLKLRQSCPDHCNYQVNIEINQRNQRPYSLPVSVTAIHSPDFNARTE